MEIFSPQSENNASSIRGRWNATHNVGEAELDESQRVLRNRDHLFHLSGGQHRPVGVDEISHNDSVDWGPEGETQRTHSKRGTWRRRLSDVWNSRSKSSFLLLQMSTVVFTGTLAPPGGQRYMYSREELEDDVSSCWFIFYLHSQTISMHGAWGSEVREFVPGWFRVVGPDGGDFNGRLGCSHQLSGGFRHQRENSPMKNMTNMKNMTKCAGQRL